MNPQRGGKRIKAGRLPVADIVRKKTHSVQMTDDQRDKAERIGCGNLSRGVQVAVDLFKREVAS